MSEKIMVNQVEIKNALHIGMSLSAIARELNIPISVIQNIRDGKDRPSFFRTLEKDRKNLCACCGIRKKHKGFRKLCIRCYVENSEDPAMDCPQTVRL